MIFPKSLIPLLQECSRDEDSFQRLLNIITKVAFDIQINCYREIARNFPHGGVIVVDEDLQHLVADGQSFTFQGLSSDMLEGRTLDELLPPDSAAEFKPLFEAALSGQKMIKELEFGQRINQFHTIPLHSLFDTTPLGMVIGVDITELQQLSRAQQKTQHFLDHVIAVFPYMLYVYDLVKKRSVFISRDFLQGLGYTQNEIGEAREDFFLSIIHSDDVSDVIAKQQRVVLLADDEVVEIEYRIRHKDGTWRWLNSRDKVFMRDSLGYVIQIMNVTQDITERKQLELEFQQKHDQLEHFFEAALDLWCVADVDGYFLNLNHIWQETLGYTLDELIGQRFLDFVHPDDLQSTLDAISVLSDQTPILNFTNRYRCKDGTYRFIEWRSRPQGKLIYATARDITERKKLEFHESYLAAIVDSSADGIIGKALDDTITSWNHAAEVMYGYTAEEMIGKPIVALIPPEYRHELAINLEKAKNGESITRYETVRLHKNGTWVEVALTISPIKDKKGEIVGISTINQNITELKQARDALQTSEAQYRAIVTSMTEGIVLQNQDGTIETCNSAAEDILGLTADQMQGRSSIDTRWHAIHEDLTPFPGETHPAMVALRTGHSVSNVVMGVYKPDQTLTWILINSRPLFYPGKHQPYAALTSFADITLIRRTELALQQSEARLRSIVETIDDAVWSVELPSLQMIYFSPVSETILGQPLGNFYQDAGLLFKIIHTDDYLDVQEAYETALETGSLDVEFRILRPDGEIRWIRNRGRLVNNDQGQPMRLEGIVSDLTEHKLMQQRKLDLEIERERVQLLSDFITNTSHELRTPLAIIGTSVYLMRRLNDPQLREVKILQVEEQIQYLNTMINQLHDMVQLDRLTRLNTTQVHLNNIVKKLTASFSSKKQNVTIRNLLLANVPAITGDADYIQQAVFHLLDNAVRFSPEGGEVVIRTSFTGREVTVDVEDKGPGIAPIYHERIFERFYKVDSARTRDNSGLGMGLAFVRQIMKLHNGRVTVRSRMDKGTTFSLHFPLSSAQMQA